MAVQNIVLYGPRSFGSSTYSTNQDPQSFSANLFDSTTIEDTGFQFLADALALIEAAIRNDAMKALAESLSMTEEMLFSAVKILLDQILINDIEVDIAQTKGLSEFILTKDWLELRIQKAEIWQTTRAFGFRPSNIHNYGPGVYYGVDFYSSNPSVNWLLSTPNTTTWQMNVATVREDSLYAQTMYGQKPYSVEATPGWTKPTSSRQNWTNANGESHN